MELRQQCAETAEAPRLPCGARISLMPSLSDLAFVTPILVLFWCASGVGWLLTDSDTGWHIRTGEWILKNGRVPATDIFSFTNAGQPWFAWEWLSDVLMAVVHEHSGLAGIVLLSLVLLGATSAFVYRNSLEESGHRVIAIVLTGLAMAATTVHWLSRPHLVTPLFAAVFCCVLNRTERERRSVFLWILPLLTLPWVNLHGGFFVGIALLVTYATGAAVEELAHGRRRTAWARARPYLWTAVACTLASLVNPYGYHLHIHIARYLGSSFYLQRISEFQSIDFHSFTAAYFETLLVLAIAAAFWHLGKGRWVQVLLLLSWLHLALFLGPKHSDLRGCDRARHWPGGACIPASPSWPRFPVDAATFLAQKEYGPSIRLYSSWQWGGYQQQHTKRGYEMPSPSLITLCDDS